MPDREISGKGHLGRRCLIGKYPGREYLRRECPKRQVSLEENNIRARAHMKGKSIRGKYHV